MSYQNFFHNRAVARLQIVRGTIITLLFFALVSLGGVRYAGAEDDSAPDTQQSEAATTTDASVTTGDADASLDTETNANTNDTTATTTTSDESQTNVENENEATTDTTGTVVAETGENAASSEGGATIDTGSAESTGNVINVINTNVFNANGLLYFLNILLGNVTLDLRELFSVLAGNTTSEQSPCSLDACDEGNATLTIQNQNAAVVTNDLTVGATTGGNEATAGTGTAAVSTGDANASANVVNVVNTNIVGSNYLLLAINNFASFGGDIVFPGAEWFTNLFGKGGSSGNTSISNTNTASVENNVSTEANTGDNAATGTETHIATGNASAAATVVNQVNTNVFGDSLLFLFRIHGAWSGDVFGLPEGMAWRETGDGIELFLSPTGIEGAQGNTDNLTVNNNNTATVTNNVSVYALTGDNKANAANGEAAVTTGDAHASANVVNVVNTNILGRNWVLAIFNIFGDWSGNVSFGQPNLWVGARAIAPSDLRAGACFNYEVTVNNLGDAVATNVYLDAIFDEMEQKLQNVNPDIANRFRIAVGRISPHGSRSITVPTCLTSTVPGGSSVDTTFNVGGHETDADTANNTEAISVVTIVGGGGSALRLGPSKLSIEKTVSEKRITASSTVDYKITITNKGDPVYNALLIDTIYNEAGEPIHEQRWGLETIHTDETIVISYTALFNSSTTPGTYTNKAFVSGTERNPDFEHNLGTPLKSPVASADVYVGPEEKVVEQTVCTPLLTSYIRYGADNDRDEVNKLQHFLRSIEHADGVSLTGMYDEVTYHAVHDFQKRYADEILYPWGIAQTTGYVYYTTQKKVNELWCKDQHFPLSNEQEEEIAAFKNHVRAIERTGGTVPESEIREVGLAPAKEDTVLAEADPAKDEEDASDQVAAASEAVANEAVEGIWTKVRGSVSKMFSWMGL